MDYRTPTEKELHGLIGDLLGHIQNPSMSRHRFADLTTRVRDAKIILDNLMYGCKSGNHASPCLCNSGVNKCVRTLEKQRAKERNL